MRRGAREEGRQEKQAWARHKLYSIAASAAFLFDAAWRTSGCYCFHCVVLETRPIEAGAAMMAPCDDRGAAT
jgi:hypothetical protein